MLTRKQHELLMFIHERLKESGIPPSFDEMKEALDLASKSGIHRLITALEDALRAAYKKTPGATRHAEVKLDGDGEFRVYGIEIPEDWRGVDAVWPLLERMRADGAIVLVKLDGARTGPHDGGAYTVLASGAPLAGEPIRTDAATVEAALAFVIARYASRAWNVPLPT